MNLHRLHLAAAALLLFSACGGEEEETPAEIRLSNNRTAYENEANAVFSFDIRIDEAKTTEVRVVCSTAEGTALDGEDFIGNTETIVFAPGETKKTFEVDIIVDEWLEPDEHFTVRLSAPEGGYLRGSVQESTGTIRNDDQDILLSDAGYSTPNSYDGMTLVWSDEFDSPGPADATKWVYETGDGSAQGIPGWGNQELQDYTTSPENVKVENDRLFIIAKKTGAESYTSGRIKTEGLFDFQFGRVDIRAVLPQGQGMWPALWMLGTNITEVGWPACGEIDIMELKGRLPQYVIGTTHWGPNYNQRRNSPGTYGLEFPNTFSDEFHVFSLIWEEDLVQFLVDDIPYHDITPADMDGFDYPFNNPFYFIMNVAVGGNFDGPPDDTTPFPSYMAVDYIRVFQ